MPTLETPPDGPPDEPPVRHRPVPRALADSFGYLLHRAFLLAEEVGLRHMEPPGHPREFAVMAMLRTATPRSQVDLAGALNINRTVMVKIVDDLERRGLIERRRSTEDRRRYVLALTDEGHRTVRDMAGPVVEATREFTAPLTADQVGELTALLRPLVLPGMAADLPAVLTGSVPFLVVHAHLRLLRQAADAIADLAFQPRHYGLLAVLDDVGPVPQQRIAQHLCVSGPTVVDMVDALEASGHLRRERNAADRRAYALTLTPAGERDLATARRRLRAVAERFTEPVGADGHARLRALLRTLVTGA
jgi:DNA-binding MarR family transcriptional regulator